MCHAARNMSEQYQCAKCGLVLHLGVTQCPSCRGETLARNRAFYGPTMDKQRALGGMYAEALRWVDEFNETLQLNDLLPMTIEAKNIMVSCLLNLQATVMMNLQFANAAGIDCGAVETFVKEDIEEFIIGTIKQSGVGGFKFKLPPEKP